MLNKGHFYSRKEGRKGTYPGYRGAGLQFSKISREESAGELPLEGWPRWGVGTRHYSAYLPAPQPPPAESWQKSTKSPKDVWIRHTLRGSVPFTSPERPAMQAHLAVRHAPQLCSEGGTALAPSRVVMATGEDIVSQNTTGREQSGQHPHLLVT